MHDAAIIEDIGATKANMDGIYFQPDPRAYFRELAKLNYIIPDLAKPIFRTLADARRSEKGDTIRLLDLGCSYGVNAAILKHDLSMAALNRHWSAAADASSEAVIDTDHAYFGALPADALEVIGLDQSEPAIAYAEDSGLIERGLALNLEESPLPESATGALAPVDLILSTGCVGYVGPTTFERLMPAVSQGEKPWIANFVLRMFPFDAIAECLSQYGYVTEKLERRSFVQRDFVSADERGRVLDDLATIGVDPMGKEADGQFHAEFFLSRPKEDSAIPVAELVGG